MDWFKKHTDTVMVLTAILGATMWMNGKFNDIDNKFASLEKEMAIMKTVLIMKDLMPTELAIQKDKQPNQG